MRTRLVPFLGGRSSIRWVMLLAVGLVLAGLLSPTVPRSIAATVDWANGVTSLVSVNSAGTAASNRFSQNPVFSPDDTLIAFESLASDLDGVTPDTNGNMDVYIRGLASGTTFLASVNGSGTNAGNGGSGDPVFSADGTMIVFQSSSSDLDAAIPDRNFDDDVYVRDLETGETHLVSMNSSNTGAGNAASYRGLFSPDGTMIAFFSDAQDLDANTPITTEAENLYIRDLDTGTTKLLSVNADGSGSGNNSSGPILGPAFSPDGTSIAFESRASDLDGSIPDTNGTGDVYLHDLLTGVTTLVSVNAAGTASADGWSQGPVFSPDGTRIAFTSEASDLDAATPGLGREDVYVRHLETGVTTMVSVASDGTAAGGSWGPVFSADGRSILFESDAATLDAATPDTNGWHDIYVRDLDTSTTTLVSANSSGVDAGNSWSTQPVFCGDNYVAFYSAASDLDALGLDDNSSEDVFVRDIRAEATVLVSVNSTSTGAGDSWSGFPVCSPEGTRIAFHGRASNLDGHLPDNNEDYDVYLRAAGANQAPELHPIGDQDVSEGVTLDVAITAVDPDDDPLAYTIAGEPAFSTFTDHGDGTATLTMAPVVGDQGSYHGVTVTVSDGVHSDAETFSIRVSAPSPPPSCTILGTPGPDTLVGTARDDVICGLGGDDVIYGRQGNDELHGGPGNDRLIGGNGADTIFGDTGDDTIHGGRGGDTLDGGGGDDTIKGYNGADTLYGQGGADHLEGNRGDDNLFGGDGTDTCKGGRGADTLVDCE